MIEISQKHLTIREAKSEIKKLENELDLYATKKNINLLRTQPGAVKLKELIVDSSHTNYDNFLNYVSKDEEYDIKIYSLLSSIYAYKSYIAKEIERISKTDEIGYIEYLKYDEHKSWREIDRILHRGDDYSRVKYYRAKKQKINSQCIWYGFDTVFCDIIVILRKL